MPSGIYKRIKKILSKPNYFQKGHPSWNKGLHIQTNTGKTHFKKEMMPWNKGKRGYKVKPCSEERKIKIGLGNKGKIVSKEAKKKIGLASRGRKNPMVSKIMKGRTGENHPRWIKDRTKLKKSGGRRNRAYDYWRRQVLERDNWKCRIANQDCKGKLVAHHILPWRDFPELRYKINNGITLCQYHHPRKRIDEQKLTPFFQNKIKTEILKASDDHT